ncbi:MAG: hypothetical protein FWC61_00400, partial [Proteobacteria bacterium]|nr:hypothetical protein [Pseudomonadota bacterium]
TGGTAAAVSCSTVGSGYVTDSTGASSSSQCHADPNCLTMQADYPNAFTYDPTFKASNPTWNGKTIYWDQTVYNNFSSRYDSAYASGFYVQGMCSTLSSPVYPDTGYPTFSATGTYCWCRLKYNSNNCSLSGSGWVQHGNLSTSCFSHCPYYCAQMAF